MEDDARGRRLGDAANRETGFVVFRVSAGRHDDADMGWTAPRHLHIGKTPVSSGTADGGEVRRQPRQNDLCLRISESAIEFNYFRTLLM